MGEPPAPVLPGSKHYYTVRVTNTGWRVGGATVPQQGPGPASGPVYVIMDPASENEHPVAHFSDAGGPWDCFSSSGPNIVCSTQRIPSNTTGQFTMVYEAPSAPGTYTFTITADSYKWAEYNETNNSVTLSYQVG